MEFLQLLSEIREQEMFRLLKEQNYSMLADFYEFTMANGYLKNGTKYKSTYIP